MKKNLINHPSIILIIGQRRSGKSVLGYGICEKFHEEREIPIYVVSLPKEKHHLLPDWLIPIDDIEELPENCLAIIDEGSLKYHAYKWNKKETEVMDRIISVSGQKKQTIIFILHHTTKFAVNLLREINLLLIKKPALLQSRLERSSLRKIIEEAEKEFKKLPRDEIKKNTYVISEDFTGFIRNKLPKFWSEDLSEAWSGIALNEEEKEETPEKMKPFKIENGLKLWFLPKDQEQILHILSENSTVDGELSSLGVICTGKKCHYDFDLKLIGDKYRIMGKVDIADSIECLENSKINYFIDVESAYELKLEDVDLKPYVRQKQVKKDELEEFADKVEL